MKGFQDVLELFSWLSGLKVNFAKTAMFGVNISEDEAEALAHYLNCSTGSSPFEFLGVLIGANPRLVSTWTKVINRFRERLKGWKGRFLSFGGRIVMINSVLNSLPTHYMSLFLAPKGVVKQLERFRKNFLWGGSCSRSKIPLMAWSKVCLPSKKEDLALCHFEQKTLFFLQSGGVGMEWNFKFTEVRLNGFGFRIQHVEMEVR
ncbi:hypothetical protein Tco_1480475 [Tanacetum coccineum]